ncbi:hypothetical protein GCM10009504_06890 [Pseudomonas laurentiana]|nr:hypothetical protein GCM10009504_06890 [Pseudomonas laurentiana]
MVVRKGLAAAMPSKGSSASVHSGLNVQTAAHPGGDAHSVRDQETGANAWQEVADVIHCQLVNFVGTS